MKKLAIVALGVIGFVAAAHSYLAVSYGTLAPCQAAAEHAVQLTTAYTMDKMTSDPEMRDNPFAAVGMALIGPMINGLKPAITAKLREKGLPTCYAVAFGAYDEKFLHDLGGPLDPDEVTPLAAR
jgi:hypothetical protein